MIEYKKKLTIKDMAKALNVSTATISNAFNRPDQLSESLRLRIIEGCQRLGYEGPNAAARSLRTGVSGIVGVLLADSLSYCISDPVASQFLAGLADVLDQRQCNMLLLPGQEEQTSYKSRQMESMVDGYIIYGGLHPSKRFQRLLQQSKPIIAVDVDTTDFITVNIDNQDGAYRSACLALQHRPQKVAIISLRLTPVSSVSWATCDACYASPASVSRSRWLGYMQALQEYNYPLEQLRVVDVPVNTHRNACMAAFMLLNQEERPDVIICMSDRMALGALQVALQQHIAVPNDLKIVGFDGIAESQFTHPTLTTVQQYNEHKGQMAGNMFLGLAPRQNVILPTDMLMGETCPSVVP